MSKVDAGGSAPTVKAPTPPKAPEPVKAPAPPKAPEPTKKSSTPDPAPVEKSKGGAKTGTDEAPSPSGSGNTGGSKPRGALSKALDAVGSGLKSAKSGAHREQSTAEVVAQRVEDRRGRSTSNDGKADTLVAGNHEGNRDEEIAALSNREAHLKNVRVGARSELKELKADLQGKQDIVKGVSAISGTAGKALGSALGIGDTKDAIKELEADLDDYGSSSDSLGRTLAEQRNLNMLADLAHATSMPDPVADVLEGDRGPEIDVVKDLGTDGAEAIYDERSNTVEVDDDLLQEMGQVRHTLDKAGDVDENGNVVDATAVDASGAADDAISAAGLIGVHELTHGAQAAGNDAMGEYEAYANQETIELQAGIHKDGFLTVRPDGSLLPKQQAAANLAAFQRGVALPYGASAGQAFGSGISAGEDPAGRRPPGRRPPGRRPPGRRPPGSRIDTE